MIEQDKEFLRRAIILAKLALAQGNDPFGAVLVKNNVIVAEMADQSVMLSDPTAHAELHLIRTYCQQTQLFSLDGYTLYTSTEPCLMCSGAIHWSRISRVVFSVSQAMLQKSSGGNAKASCRDLLSQRVDVVGPLIPEEGLAVIQAFDFTPKLVRHQHKFGVRNQE